VKKSEYAKYLQSNHWQSLRKEVLKHTSSCERCRLPRWLASVAYDQDLNVHHTSYANLGNEDWMDLQVLCRYCHEIETFGRTDLRPVKSARCEMCGEIHYDVYAKLCRTCERVFNPPSLYELLESGTADDPIIFYALDGICLILRKHGVKADGINRYVTKQFEKLDKEASEAATTEVPF